MSNFQPYILNTQDIEIAVIPVFLPDSSNIDEGLYVWAYQVEITNGRSSWIQLLSRYWHITDGMGRVEEVEGEGVVGEQPIIQPGASYRYASGCPLPTDTGMMRGHYVFMNDQHQEFRIPIPPFSLDMQGDHPIH